MQFKWGLGNRHRTFMHNIWAMLVIASIAYYMFPNYIIFIGVSIGYISHLLVDSTTVTGVYWLYPFEGIFHLRGPINMSDKGEGRIEVILQSLMLGMAGLLFLSKDMAINLFSTKGIIALAVLTLIGYFLMEQINRILHKFML
jgi:membrane-bound metal-dependent hydrolase YbcI (DUF457 family)